MSLIFKCPLVRIAPIQSLAAFSSSASKSAKSKGEGNGRKKSPPVKDVPAESLPEPEPNRAAGESYLVPEYYSHDMDSYADLNMQMQQYRLPRPVKPQH